MEGKLFILGWSKGARSIIFGYYPFVHHAVLLPPGKGFGWVDRLNRNFLWGSTDAAKKIHWVGWEKVMKSKEEGGLGLQIAKRRNVALLAKLNWRFQMEGEAYWVRVLKMKNCSQRRKEAANADTLPCSSTWIAMKKGVDTFNKGSRWLVTKK